MKNLLFYAAFLLLAGWAGNQLNSQVPQPSPLPAAKADTSSVIKQPDYPAPVQASAYTRAQ